MKVLIFGGYSYIGSFIADKFLSEKHFVGIIDECKDSGAIRKTNKQKYYCSLSDVSGIEKVLDSVNFDLAVFISNTLIPKKDDNSSDLSKVLILCAAKRIKKFILLSSCQVYGNNIEMPLHEKSSMAPVTMEGISDNVKEYYCLKIGKTKGMPVLCLRVSDFYGPYKSSFEMDKANIIGRAAVSAIKGEQLIINGSEDTYRDFIYIYDAAEAICRAALKKDFIGIANVSSNTSTSFSQIIGIVNEQKIIKRVKYKEKTPKELPEGTSISNERIKNELDWGITANIEEGIKKTFKEQEIIFVNEDSMKRQRVYYAKKKKVSSKSFLWLAFIESFFLLFLFGFLQWGHVFFNVRIFDIGIDYAIIYIIIAAVIWGQIQAYFAMSLASILFIAVSLFSGIEIITFIYSPENLIRLALYLIIGIITGYAIEHRNREIESRDISYKALSNKYGFLLNIYNQIKIVKNELEKQVINSEESFSSIYETLQKVDNLELETLYSGAVAAIEKIMKTASVSIYVTNLKTQSPFLRLKARSNSLANKIANSINIDDLHCYRQVIESRSIYINKKLDPNCPLMISPVIDSENVIALITVHEAEFENLNANYENLFKTITTLITSAIKKVYYFEDNLRHTRYIEDTDILNAETFEKVLLQVKKNKKQFDMDYSLLAIQKDGLSLKELSKDIMKTVRENDYLGVDSECNIFVLLSNTATGFAHIVIKRLLQKGIVSQLVEEEYFD